MEIVVNRKEYLEDFIRLNEAWISHYFKLEAVDRLLAEDPFQVIRGGGYIFTALSEQGVVEGVCALFNEGGGVYELARMAVSPEAQGKGVGNCLMLSCLEMLARISAEKVYLVSNTRLKAAIKLYQKHGFITTFMGAHPVYSRADIIMERRLISQP